MTATKRKSYNDCSLDELDPCPMNLYIYSVHVLKGRLPDEYHEKMISVLKDDPKNAYAMGYLKLIGEGGIWHKFVRFLKNFSNSAR